MTRFALSVDIAAPVERIFNFVADYRNALKYMAQFRTFQPVTSVTSGLGARVLAKGQMHGLPIATELEIVGYEQNRRLVSASRSGIRSASEWIFEPDASGTKVTFIAQYELPRIPLGRLLNRLIEDEIRSGTRRTLENLKRLMEDGGEGLPHRRRSQKP